MTEGLSLEAAVSALRLMRPDATAKQVHEEICAQQAHFAELSLSDLKRACSKVAKRESKSRPDQGIVTVATKGINQRGETVVTFKRNMLIPKKGHAVEDKVETY